MTPAVNSSNCASEANESEASKIGSGTAIYVITLSSAVDRQKMFRDSAAQQDITQAWNFFSGKTALSDTLRYDADMAIVARGRPLHDRELACYSSHYEAWRAFLDTDAQQLVVMEDDVLLDWKFLERVIRDDLAANGINYLKFFSKNMTPHRVISNDFHGRWLLDCRGFAYGMQAYFLTRTGAERFVAHCSGHVTRPIDDELDRSWAHGVPNLTVFPFPALELSGPSLIGADRDHFRRLPLKIKWKRILARTQESILRMKQKVTGFGFAKSYSAYPSRRFGKTHIQKELL